MPAPTVTALGVWAGAALLTATCFQTWLLTYKQIYFTSRYLAKAEGYDWRHPSVHKSTVWGAGVLGSVGAGMAAYLPGRALLRAILLPPPPPAARTLIGVLTTRSRPGLTPAALWAGIGPAATPATLRALAGAHGAGALSFLLPFAWAGMLAPYAQARVEALVVFKGPLTATPAEAAAELRTRWADHLKARSRMA